MGRRRYTGDHFPAWTLTVGDMAAMMATGATGCAVSASCTVCQARVPQVDVFKLLDAKGPAYSLIGRRSPCREPGCDGWMRFFYQSGVMRPLWRQADVDRWIREGTSQYQPRAVTAAPGSEGGTF